MKQKIIIILLFITSFAKAQDFSAAEKYLDGGNIPEAVKEFEKLSKQNPNDPEVFMLLGYCYINSPNLHEKAIPSLQKSLELFTESKSKKGEIDATFLLGIAYRKNLEFDKALDIFNKLIIDKEYADYKSIDILEREINYCINAKKNYAAKDFVRVRNVGTKVNSEYTEHSPVYIEINHELIFTSKISSKANKDKGFDGEYNENIYSCKYQNFKADSINLLNIYDNDKKSYATCWISSVGDKMLLHYDGNIYYIEKQGDKWTKPEPFKEINSIYREPDACMNDAGDIVYFISDKSDGYGGLDIYKITKDGKGKWSNPENLGNKINTKFDDNSPYLHPDGTFYFASEGHNSIGGYDIFAVEPKGKKNFSEPVNIGVPINSIDDDIFYYLSPDKKLAFFTSNRTGSIGRADIFSVNYADSSLKYLEIKGLALIENQISDSISINIFSIKSKANVYEGITNEYGEYSINIDRGLNYFTEISEKGYFFEAFTFSAPVDTISTRNLNKISLQKIEPGNVNKQYAIKFANDDYILDYESEIFANSLVKFSIENPDLQIDLSVKDTTSSKISSKRIQSIVDYLKKHGISDEKVSTNLMKSNLSDNEVLVTILDNSTKQYAFGQKVNNINLNGDPANIVNNSTNNNSNVNGNKNNNANFNLSAGNSFEKGIYTIQLGAFKIRKNSKDILFKNLNPKPSEYKCNTGYWHYTFGKYKFKNEAENNLMILQKMGFTDAFVREIDWYNQNKI